MLLVASALANTAEMPRQQEPAATISRASGPVQSGLSVACQDTDEVDLISNQETGNNRKQSSAALFRSRAGAFTQDGDWARAEECYRSALLKDRQPGNQNLAEALDLAGIGHVAVRLGNPIKAQDYYQQALAIQERLEPYSLSTARSLNGLGEATLRWGDVAQAEQYFQRAQAILRKLGHQGGPDFALSLNGLGSATQQRGYLAKAELFHRRALSIQQREAPQSLDLADTLDYLGLVSYLGSRYRKAEDYYNRSLALRKQFLGGGLDIAWSMNGLGDVAFDQGDLVKAEDSYRHAFNIAQRFAPDSLVVGTALTNLCLISYRHGDLSGAETCQRQALASQDRLAPHGLDVATSLRRLGEISDRRGDLAQAEEYVSRSLDIRQQLVPSSPAVANSLVKLGVIADRKGDLIEAEKHYIRALGIQEKLDPASLTVARSLHALGSVAQKRRDFARAQAYHHRALGIYQKILPGSLLVANSLIHLALLADDLEDQAKAEYYCRKALAIKQKIAPDTIDLAENLNVMGQIMFNHRAFHQAESYLQQALSIQRKLNPGSLQVASNLHFLGMISHARGDVFSAQNLEDEALSIQEKLAPATLSHAEMLASLASILRDEDRWDSSAQLYERSLEALEGYVTRFGGGTEPRSQLRASYAHLYEEYANLLMQQGNPELAFAVSERQRARSLLEMLTQARIDIHKGIDDRLLEQEHRLQKTWTARSSERIQLLAHNPGQQQLAQADKEIEELSKQYQELQEEIRQKSPDYAALTNPRTLRVSEVQKLLDPNTLLLEYSLGKETSFLWVVSSEGFSSYQLPKRTEIEHLVRRAYQLLTAPGQITPGESVGRRRGRLENAQRAYWKTAASLSHMILGPASAQLKDKRLLIVSDGALQYAPFAALPEPDSRDNALHRVNPPLMVRHEIANLPSASVLAALRENAIGRKAPASEVVVLADPVFGEEDARVKKTNKHQEGEPAAISAAQRNTNFLPVNRVVLPASNSLLLKRGGIRLTRLPFSRDEAKVILAATPAGRGKVALDFAANLDLAISPKLAQYRIVHFATHGIFNSKNPELSGLVFSTVDPNGNPQNGFLDLQGIYNLNLPVDLVVLSACETALGKEVPSEGLVGLTRGFMYAGALQVMASLWKIDDARTADLMKYFYRAVEQENLVPAAALRKAQIHAWTQKPWALPFYWAAFEVQGD